jgi:hypothetical protein
MGYFNSYFVFHKGWFCFLQLVPASRWKGIGYCASAPSLAVRFWLFIDLHGGLELFDSAFQLIYPVSL